MTKIRILCATLYTLLAVGANPLTANTLNVNNLLNIRSGDMRLVAIHTEPKNYRLKQLFLMKMIIS